MSPEAPKCTKTAGATQHPDLSLGASYATATEILPEAPMHDKPKHQPQLELRTPSKLSPPSCTLGAAESPFVDPVQCNVMHMADQEKCRLCRAPNQHRGVQTREESNWASSNLDVSKLSTDREWASEWDREREKKGGICVQALNEGGIV